MRKIGNGFVVVMFLAGSLLTGCASVGGDRSSGAYDQSFGESAESGSISQYTPVSYSAKNDRSSQTRRRGSS